MALTERLKEIPIGRGAQSLLPGVVAGAEVRVVGDVLGKLFLGTTFQDPASCTGVDTAKLIEQKRDEEELPAHELEGQPLGEQFAHDLSKGIDSGLRYDVGWTALEHGYHRSLLGKDRDNGDGRRATANDYHLLACIIEVLGPELRMDSHTLEIF